MRKLLQFGIVLFAVLSIGFAQDFVVSNSADWRDVYSSVLYARLIDAEPKFLVAPGGVELTLLSMNRLRFGDEVLLVESSDKPVVADFQGSLESRQFRVEKLSRPSGTQLNFELAKLSETKSFIVVDDDYGYNAISVASYAALTNSYVIFVNRQNLEEVHSFLSERNPDRLILYGVLDKNVIARLAEFGPEIINRGNRFDNNIEIVRRFLRENPTNQAIITDGSIIEYDLVSTKFPTLFIGETRTPEPTLDFVNESGITITVLVGEDKLLPSAKILKDQTGASVFVKFAQGTSQDAAQGALRAIDMFPLPKYVLSMEIDLVNYNVATKQVEVVYRNTGNVGFFFKPSVTINANNAFAGIVSEKEPIFIENGETLGRAYDLDLTSQIAQNAKLDSVSLLSFGEDSGVLDLSVTVRLEVVETSLVDTSAVELKKAVYDVSDSRLKLDIENTGSSDTYVQPIIRLEVGTEERILRLDSPQKVKSGEEATIRIREIISPNELNTVGDAIITLRYGERSNLLLKSIEQRLEVEVLKADYTILLAAGAIILLLVAFAVLRKPSINKTAAKSKKR